MASGYSDVQDAEGRPPPPYDGINSIRATVWGEGEERLLSLPVNEERDLKIICIGAGASGLLLAYKLQRSFEKFELAVYEKNSDVAGTWHENRYPGCACDVPAHNYTYSFEPSASWSSVYAGSAEISTYFRGFSQKYNLGRYIKTRHQIVGAQWDETHSRWDVRVTDLATGRTFVDTCHVLVNAGGILNSWKWPEIKGLKTFGGRLMHSADWDESVSLFKLHPLAMAVESLPIYADIYSSSGIQILPSIQPVVSHLSHFIRSPTWVAPHGMEQHIYTPEEKQTFATVPGSLLAYRKAIECRYNQLWPLFVQSSKVQADAFIHVSGEMKGKLKNPELEGKVIPKWPVGCRRLTPGDGYLEALGKENVDVVWGDIQEVTPAGVVGGDGKEHPLDILICATGFDTSFTPRFPILNQCQQNLQDLWASDPARSPPSYLGLAAPHFPNYLTFLGPNSPIGNGPVLSGVEAQADYILKLLDRYQTDFSLLSFSPSPVAVSSFLAHKDRVLATSVFAAPCRSWYKNHTADGPIAALWPGSTLHYIEALQEVRYDDWVFTRRSEEGPGRWCWLGNGYSRTEKDMTADWAWYVREEDSGPYLSRGKWRKEITGSGKGKLDESIRISGVALKMDEM
ncbi:MAG: hypothetical protein M1839_006955 [Geoglossum umbratile]|nr:MAG: hypothetical protein M1839_006955 [Geoglossum umbratile]